MTRSEQQDAAEQLHAEAAEALPSDDDDAENDVTDSEGEAEELRDTLLAQIRCPNKFQHYCEYFSDTSLESDQEGV